VTTLRWKLLPTLLLLGLGIALVLDGGTVSAGAASGDGGDGGNGDDQRSEPAAVEEAAPTTLGDLRADPAAWLGQRVRFTVQFCKRLDDWNPLMTRFGSTDWAAFSAWADEDFTWEAYVYDHPMTRLFVRRGGAADELMGEMRTYERFEVTGVVREVFVGEPWIEVESFRPLFELVSEGTILHVGRAFEFARQAQWDLAIDQFERAKTAPIPDNARAELDRRIEQCRKEKAEKGRHLGR